MWAAVHKLIENDIDHATSVKKDTKDMQKEQDMIKNRFLSLERVLGKGT